MRHGFRVNLLFPLLIVVIGVMAHHNSFLGVFVFDDQRTIALVLKIDGLLRGARPLLRVSWRPVADATFLLNRILGGRVADYHALNLLFHVASGLVLYGLVRRSAALARFPDPDHSSGTILAFVCAALWVCHPLTTSAVTYVVQRYEVMMTFFYLSTLYCVARGMSESGGGTGWNLAAILTCWLGMGCKEVMITAPVGVVLYHLAFRKEVSTMPLRGRWWLYLGLAVGWGMLVVLMRIKVRHDLSRYYVWPGFSPVLYVLTAPKVLWRYLWLSVFPKDLCFDYAWPVPNRVGIPDFLGCVAVMGVTVFFVYEILRHKPWAFPPTLALLVLAPTMLIPRPDPVVEYRMYLPLAAVLCTAVVALYQVFRRIVVHYGHGMLRVWVRGFGWLVFVGIIVWFSFMTLARNCDYHSAERLWRGVIRLRPENLRARVALGSVLLQEGRVREAEECFRDVIRLSESKVGEGPSVAMTARAFALKELAMILHRRGQSREAATLLREALRIAPDFVDARKSLAFVEGQEVEEREEK